MSKTFTHCNVPENKMIFRWQTFVNGEKHIACHCSKCNDFVAYVPKIEPYTNLVSGEYISTTQDKYLCKKCNIPLDGNIYEWHKMKSGKIGIRCNCGECGGYIAYVPHKKPYIDLVSNTYESANREGKPTIQQIKAIDRDSIKDVLATILKLPGIKEYIGAGLYNKAKTMI